MTDWIFALGVLLVGTCSMAAQASDNVVKAYPAPDGEDLFDGYSVRVNGEASPVYRARVCAFPLNAHWPGTQRPLDQTELAGFCYWDMNGPVTVEVTPHHVESIDKYVKNVQFKDPQEAKTQKGIVAAMKNTKSAFANEAGTCLPAEGCISAAEIKAGAVILRYKADSVETVTGFHTRLANCIGPREEAVEVALRSSGGLSVERTTIPVYGAPLNMYTRQKGRVFPPLDVAQEYHVALAVPLEMKPGDEVTLEIVSSGPMSSGVAAGLQFAGRWPLLEMREPFRQTKAAGPVSRIAWSSREVVCTGNQKKFDPQCAPQNNSVVVGDADGALFQFTAFYSVDEQYGGGRGGSYARTYAYRKRPDTKEWESLGAVMELPEGITYLGDPYAFRDLDGTPRLIIGVVDGTNGFVDGQKLGPVAVTDPAQRKLLAEPQRFKFYGWQGGLYTIRNAYLTDGPEPITET